MLGGVLGHCVQGVLLSRGRYYSASMVYKESSIVRTYTVVAERKCLIRRYATIIADKFRGVPTVIVLWSSQKHEIYDVLILRPP